MNSTRVLKSKTMPIVNNIENSKTKEITVTLEEASLNSLEIETIAKIKRVYFIAKNGSLLNSDLYEINKNGEGQNVNGSVKIFGLQENDKITILYN